MIDAKVLGFSPHLNKKSAPWLTSQSFLYVFLLPQLNVAQGSFLIVSYNGSNLMLIEK